MSRLLLILTFFGAVLVLTAVAPGQSPSGGTAAPARHKRAKSRHKESPDRPSEPSGQPYGPPFQEPDPPKTPGEMPPVQPRVSYRDGLLTIEAPNSTLSSVLAAIHNKTGIQFEGPQGGPERVVVRTGPAPVDDVLLELLHGSRFDYVMVGREDNPAIVQRVILTLRSGGVAPPASIGQNRPVQPEVQEEEESGDPPPVKQETPSQPPLVQPQQPGGKTQDQILLEKLQQQELQRRQQQQRLQRLQQQRIQQQQQKPDDPPL